MPTASSAVAVVCLTLLLHVCQPHHCSCRLPSPISSYYPTAAVMQWQHRCGCRFRPPRLPPTWFSWMHPVFMMPDEEFVACAGFDALAYCRFLNLAVRLTFWVALISCAITLPTNWAAGTAIEKQLEQQRKKNEELRIEAMALNLTEIPTVEAACSSPDEPEAAVADAAAVRAPPTVCTIAALMSQAALAQRNPAGDCRAVPVALAGCIATTLLHSLALNEVGR